MNEKKISYSNLREEASAGKLPALVGRFEEIERLDRIVNRRVNNNVALVAPSGAGKTGLVYGWMRHLASREEFASLELLQFDVEHLYALDDDAALEERYLEAFAHLPRCVLFIDDFGREVTRNTALMQRVFRVYKRILKEPNIHVVLALTPQEYEWFEREFAAFLHLFETIMLKEQTAAEHARILSRTLPVLNARHRVIVTDAALAEVVALTARFPVLGQMPKAAIRILDESISFSASKRHKVLRQDAIAQVIETKTGVPKSRLTADEISSIKDFESSLNARVRGQGSAIAKIAKTLQRAKLGLRNPDRPLGSFLLLGPSGVGKTETAKSVAELIFGRAESFSRFDMSEFQQDHTVQRLIGAPAGYIGFEEGGSLTNALKREPHSLILLDEIEKAHPKVFDIFLQVLDDGRLTSGQNETVDARNAIVMATSNAAVPEILDAFESGGGDMDDTFIEERVMPALAKTFRLEFINRFDAILVFKPLTVPGLVEIAQLEIKKIEKRLGKHGVQFELEPAEIEAKIATLADPRFGARPVKRFIEETCETLLADSLMAGKI